MNDTFLTIFIIICLLGLAFVLVARLLEDMFVVKCPKCNKKMRPTGYGDIYECEDCDLRAEEK